MEMETLEQYGRLESGLVLVSGEERKLVGGDGSWVSGSR